MSIDLMRSASDRRRTPALMLLLAVAALLHAGVAQGQEAADSKQKWVTITGFVADPVTCLSDPDKPEPAPVPKETLMPGNRPIKAAKGRRGYYEIHYGSGGGEKKCFVRGGAVLIEKTGERTVASCPPIVVAQNRAGGTRGATEGCR